ncbi:LOW QUALITY PROTEIN: olfactory receptor 1E16-like [Rhinophrynus dorsalis]
MDNLTNSKVFHILAFSSNSEKRPYIFIIFLLLYLIGVLWNLVIIIVIYKDNHLHTPMYLFLSNLSFVDICYPTVTLPKLMDILLSGNNSISLVQCFSQMFFFIFMGGTEIVLLSSMAYDRYVAICHPLHYYRIMNWKKCSLLLCVSWISGCGNAIFLLIYASKLLFCDSNNIHQFFCDVKALSTISCADAGFQIMIFIEAMLYGLCPFLLSLSSYMKIIAIILQIKDGRKKAFSTCTSHLTVIILYYATILCMYMRPPAEKQAILDHILSVLYSSVTPMLNPLIYSLRNKDVKSALIRFATMKTKESKIRISED